MAITFINHISFSTPLCFQTVKVVDVRKIIVYHRPVYWPVASGYAAVCKRVHRFNSGRASTFLYRFG